MGRIWIPVLDHDQVPTVLLVADDLAVIRLVTLTLDLEGFRVVAASDPAEMFQHLEFSNPVLLLLNYWLRDDDGKRVLLSLRRRNRIIPTLVITISEEEGREARQNGAHDFIKAPYTPEQLVSKIRTLIAQASSKRDGVLPNLDGASPHRDSASSSADGVAPYRDGASSKVESDAPKEPKRSL